MNNTIICSSCGAEIELTEALSREIEKTVLAAEHIKHNAEIEELKIAANKEKHKTEADLALKYQLKQKELQNEAEKLAANAEINMKKKFALEEVKIREQAEKDATQKQRLELATKEKTIRDLKISLENAQRKASQGSQQLQGEILELDLEETLKDNFRDDEILPVEKGIRGADIKHIVKSPRGVICGVILWETKRTKNWTEGWVQKLKDDLRETGANIPVIVSEILPAEATSGIIHHNGIYVAKSSSVTTLASLLRKAMLEVGYLKTTTQNRDTNADALYSYVTSHQFVQQVEAMVEVYTEMIVDITKEKAVFERIWAKREAHAKKLLGSTANIIGSMQGQTGSNSMPKIKGLEIELLGNGEN